jgi:TonB family protein
MTGATANSPALEPAVSGKGWTRTRLFTVIALVTAAQAGLIILFGEKREVSPRAVLNVPTLKLADAADELLALDDPTLFVLPNSKDFASSIWLKTPTNPPPDFRWTEPPRWLALSADDLGAAFSRLMQTNFPPSHPFNFKPAVALTTPTMPAEPVLAENSTMHIEGELAHRQFPSEINLTNWPYADVLAPCVVQVLVDAAGNVISTALLKSSSYKDADDKALELARVLRFTPSAKLTLGRVIFNWHTVPATNETNR